MLVDKGGEACGGHSDGPWLISLLEKLLSKLDVVGVHFGGSTRSVHDRHQVAVGHRDGRRRTILRDEGGLLHNGCGASLTAFFGKLGYGLNQETFPAEIEFKIGSVRLAQSVVRASLDVYAITLPDIGKKLPIELV